MLKAGRDGRACGFLGRFVFFPPNYVRKEKKAPAYFGPIFNPSLINVNFAWGLHSLTGSPGAQALLGQSCGSALGLAGSGDDLTGPAGGQPFVLGISSPCSCHSPAPLPAWGRSAGHPGLCQGLACFWDMLTFGSQKRQPFEPGLRPYPQE